ncbi:related to SNF8 - protein involved in glucose derepression [Melanopsichium pennsylvanicum]|uniref:Related to SNF8 - protein involved in glucose derepression n=2 Tax=Melanopsichium pennsylvanicum TaxID=63383 RepID=A0AAJ4XSF2_9BASI|nr:related to SNF8-protein involved in glucose derepression [Melanopsichium pennsylvanicum 4]SNX86997.1 related to SNF8 - protein involved in glucose derepression [Melanopsichium pennsylvanicum]
MRRGPGLAALDRNLASTTAFSTLGADLTASQLNELRQQLDVFSTSLRSFSSAHRNEIRKNAEFRHAFQKMCYSIGVDPLSSSSRNSGGLSGLWSDMLGLGDWQYELGVQIIDVCVSTRSSNGGVIGMDELIRRVTLLRTGGKSDSRPSTRKGRGEKEKEKEAEITQDDIVRSIKMLAPLGCGYEVISLGNGDEKMVRSVARELDTDTMVVLGMLLGSTQASTGTTGGELAFLTEDTLVAGQRARGWSSERARAVLENMSVREGMLWIDEQAFPPRYYSLSTLSAS